MKIDPNCKVRNVAGEHVILLPGKGGRDMTRLVALNESSLLLWDSLHGRDFEMADVVQVLLDSYEVTAEVAAADAARWVETLKDNGLVL